MLAPCKHKLIASCNDKHTLTGLSMRRARSHSSAQARVQLSSRARFVARASFMKNIHPCTKESFHSWLFSARKGSLAYDWQRTSNLLIERTALTYLLMQVTFHQNALDVDLQITVVINF